MSVRWSSRDRSEWRGRLGNSETPLDVLVIGGGITGAGILLDAQTRGMSAALIDMQDFAAGTSSRSTKLVHGGLRYLKQFEVGLVAEVGKERAIVHANARHVTTPVRMLLPIVKGGTYGRIATSVALFVYDTLAGVRRSERHRMLSVDETLRREPLLKVEGLKGAGYYVEYRTDDARLTIENMKTAVQHGAVALNYTRALSFLYDTGGQMTGVRAQDVLTGDQFDIHARQIVNATGPWVDAMRDVDGWRNGKTLRHTKGVHIVVDGRRFPLSTSVYFDVPDGRMVFAIPRAGKTYIGTTDTDYTGNLVHPRATSEDRRYLVQAVNHMFPSVALKDTDIESSWAGIRPLIYEEGKSPSEVSRKDEVFESPSGLITIAGGKLTGYRKMAEKVTRILSEKLEAKPGRGFLPSSTEKLRLSGGDFKDDEDFERFVMAHTAEGVGLGLTESEASRLVHRYGTNVKDIFAILRESDATALECDLPPSLLAELAYAVDAEMAASPADFFIRRTGDLYFDIARVRAYKSGVVDWMGRHFEWNDALRAYYTGELDDLIMYANDPYQGSGLPS